VFTIVWGNMKTRLLFVVFFLHICLANFNKVSADTWSKSIGGIGTDIVRDVYQKSDGTFIVAGQTGSFADPNAHDGFLVKLNTSGNIIWQKTYGDPTIWEWFSSVRPTSDGGYIAVGGEQGNETGDVTSDVFVVKVNNLGSLQWKKKFTIQLGSQESIQVVRQTAAGEYLLAGNVQIPYPLGDTAGLVMKLDSWGNLMWAKRYEVDDTPDQSTGVFTDLETTAADGSAILSGLVNNSSSFRN
jgi:hypothetical protein